MIKDYKKETLKELGIYELRELARLVGVPSPTTKKREVLEEEIITYSKNQTINNPIVQNKKGRPPKSIKKVENVLDVFVPKEFAEIVINKRVDNELSDYLKFCRNSRCDEITTMTGFLRKTLSGDYYIRDNTDLDRVAGVSLKLVGSLNLVEGDKIYAQATKANEDKFFTVNEIYDVNDKKPNSNRDFIDIDNCVFPHQEIKGFVGAEEGGRIMFVSDTFRSSIEKMKNICGVLGDEYKFIILAPNITTYHRLLIEHELKGDFIYTLVEDHPSYIYDIVTNCFNYANILMAENNKVIVVIFDLLGIKHGIENHLALETEKISFKEELESSRITLKLLNMARASEKEASISVFANCMAHEQTEDFFKNSIKKNTDTILYM